MPTSVYIFLLASLLAFLPVCFDHGETSREIKETSDKCKKCLLRTKLFLLWAVPLLGLLGTVFLAWESIKSNREDAEHARQFDDESKKLAQAEIQIIIQSNGLESLKSEYNEATNALSESQKDALLASNSAASANASALNLNRHLTYDQKVKLLRTIKPFPPANLSCFFPPDVSDAVKLGNDIWSVFSTGGWNLNRHGDIGTVIGMPNGVTVESTENNGALVSSIVNTLNSIGVTSTAFTNTFSSQYPGFLRQYLAASNEVVLFIGYKPQ